VAAWLQRVTVATHKNQNCKPGLLRAQPLTGVWGRAPRLKTHAGVARQLGGVMGPKLTDAEFNKIVSFVQRDYGINLSQKRILIEGRFSNFLNDHGFTNFTQYLDFVFADKSGKEMVHFINTVTTNHTFFWREPRHFEYMQQAVLPWIEKNVRDHSPRIWCAASSSGEEPYTLCMVLDDYFSMKGDWDLRILASDIDTKMLAKAKDGIYSIESMRELPAAWRTKYFTKIGEDKFQVIEKLRKRVIYREFNLMHNIVCKLPYHLISCRNVMIYFDGPTKNNLVERFYDVTMPGGYLFIGHAESVPKTSRWNYIEPAIYRK
jgi:chemotaxis protein methyltransferase CheR